MLIIFLHLHSIILYPFFVTDFVLLFSFFTSSVLNLPILLNTNIARKIVRFFSYYERRTFDFFGYFFAFKIDIFAIVNSFVALFVIQEFLSQITSKVSFYWSLGIGKRFILSVGFSSRSASAD